MTEPTLTDTLTRAAGPEPVGFTAADVSRRVAARGRARRRRWAATATVVILAGLGVGRWGDDPDDDRVTVTAADGQARDDEIAAQITGLWDLRDVSIDAGVIEPITLELRADGTLEIEGGCDSISSADWAVAGIELVLDNASDEGEACHGGAVHSLIRAVLLDRPTVVPGGGALPVPGEPWRTLRLATPDGRFLAFERDVQSQGLPAIEGEMPDGRVWTLTDSPEHGLCVTVGDEDLGCDDIGPGIAPGADPATPRTVGGPAGEHSGDDAAELIVAYLPPDATSVFPEHDDGRPADRTGLVVDAESGLWGLPVEQGDVPDFVRYTDADDRQVAVLPIGG